MYLTLEGGKYFESYNALGKIFKELNIQPGYFYISRDEYITSTAKKKVETLNIINKYDDTIIDELNDDFIKTAKARQCVIEEDYIRFFDELLDPPKEFNKDVKLILFDDVKVNAAIDKGIEDEELIEELNVIFKNRRNYYSNKNHFEIDKEEKGKSRRPLMHDAGLIRGAEYLRKNGKCFILTREISVKQYGILKVVRDEPFISIGLDTLIGLLALDSGGIDIDPTNFKPLFAKIIKLALLPEKGVFQAADLARMLDIEQNIANLPDNDVYSIAKEMHRYQMSDVEESKITVEILRKFQNSKMHIKSDLVKTEAELISERKQKNIYKESSERTESLLMARIYKEVSTEYNDLYRKLKFRFFIIFPISTIFLTFLILYQFHNNLTYSWLGNLIGFIINIIAWFSVDFFIMLPKFKRSHALKMADIDKEVNRRMIEETNTTY